MKEENLKDWLKMKKMHFSYQKKKLKKRMDTMKILLIDLVKSEIQRWTQLTLRLRFEIATIIIKQLTLTPY
jgi:hypothetical protein